MSSAYTTDYLTAPSEAVNLAAVTQCGKEIRFITNPSWAVQQAAVTQDATAIALIDNPGEELQLAVVADGWMLAHIKNPTNAVVAKAITSTPEIVFSLQARILERVTPEALDLLKPGLYPCLEGIRALNLDLPECLALFHAALKCTDMAEELPADVDQY